MDGATIKTTLFNLATLTNFLTGLPYSITNFVATDTSGGLIYLFSGQNVSMYSLSGVLQSTITTIFSAFDAPVTSSFIYDAETYYSPAFHTSLSGVDYLLDYSSGTIWKTSEFYYADGANTIPVHIITPNLDFGNNHTKLVSELEFIGDKVSGTMNTAYSNNDYVSWIPYRQTSLSNQRSRLHRLGRARRRAYEFYYTGSTALRLEAIDLTMDSGED